MSRHYFMLILVFAAFTMIGSQDIVAATTKQVTAQRQEPYRILHFVLRGVTPERAEWIVSEAKNAGFNTVQIVLTDGVQLEHSPWKPRADTWTRKEFAVWIEKVRSLGLDIIPEVKLLTHQEKLFQKQYPGLMFNKLTYDPRKDEVYQRIFALLDEIIELMHPEAIHIGHDEVVGWNKKHALKKLGIFDQPLPADLFLKDTLTLYSYLKERQVATWMWGDMLVSPGEFPDMLSKHLHGTVTGYGKVLRDKLLKDIVICDWHYFDKQEDFPSLKSMVDEGFQVLGATWKRKETTKNFSRYAAEHGGAGMIATTWFHVQKKEWDVVDRIIKESGEILLKDFPDVK